MIGTAETAARRADADPGGGEASPPAEAKVVQRVLVIGLNRFARNGLRQALRRAAGRPPSL